MWQSQNKYEYKPQVEGLYDLLWISDADQVSIFVL